jgi:hypothetical protein
MGSRDESEARAWDAYVAAAKRLWTLVGDHVSQDPLVMRISSVASVSSVRFWFSVQRWLDKNPVPPQI